MIVYGINDSKSKCYQRSFPKTRITSSIKSLNFTMNRLIDRSLPFLFVWYLMCSSFWSLTDCLAENRFKSDLLLLSPSSSPSSSSSITIINRSENRKFPFLRALVSQFISDRRDSKESLGASLLSSASSSSNLSTLNSSSSSLSLPSSSSSSSSSSSVIKKDSDSDPSNSMQSERIHSNRVEKSNQSKFETSSSIRSKQKENSSNNNNNNNNNGNRKKNNNNNNSNVKTIQHIIEDINSQNSKISSKRRKRFLINILSRMMKSVNFTELSSQMRNGISSRASCWACNALAGLFLSPVYSKEMMTMAVNTVCTSFRLQSPRVCTGIVESFKDDLDYIRTHTTLKHGEMCGVIFGMDCARRVTKNLNWTISIPERKYYNNHAHQPKNIYHYHHQQYPYHYRLKRNDGKYGYYSGSGHRGLSKLVHITDIHVDPYYEPGSEANCGEPLCCRSTNGQAKSSDRMAGKWGDYRNCDTPVQTLRHALKHINEMHFDAEYWIWTGDVAPHDIWNVTKKEVISQMRLVTNLIKQYARVPVYPVIGNHEGVPVNSFPPPEIKGPNSISWLYDAVAEEWAFWLPEDALQTLRYGGYYMVKPRERMRVICINTNYCARLNPWSLYNPVDPANQLKWLSDELHKAEQAGDKVHIIGHIPPDNRECTQAWLYNFLRIIDRFNDTVLAQYYGHTHRDEYRLFYSPRQSETPIGLAYIGPSITPFTENNPAYRLYYMEENGFLTDHETYYFNLTEANQNDYGPKWVYEYRAVEKYGLDNMSPHSWHNLSIKMHNDDRLFSEFKNLYYRHSDVRKDERCTDKCKNYILSDLAVLHPLKNRPKRFFGRRKHSHS